MDNRILFGKSSIDKIVSIEANDDQLILFRQDDNGNIFQEIRPNRYWILAPKPYSNHWVRLKGNLHYCWGRQFKSQSDLIEFKIFHKHDDLYSVYNSKESAMIKDGICYFQNLKVEDVSILSFDIETNSLSM